MKWKTIWHFIEALTEVEIQVIASFNAEKKLIGASNNFWWYYISGLLLQWKEFSYSTAQRFSTAVLAIYN